MENNENKVSMTDVTFTGEAEIHSDPNAVKESVLNESDDINDSGMETTPSLIDENNLTQSVIISETGEKSTPVATKIKEQEWSMASMIAVSYTHLDVYKRQILCCFEEY